MTAGPEGVGASGSVVGKESAGGTKGGSVGAGAGTRMDGATAGAALGGEGRVELLRGGMLGPGRRGGLHRLGAIDEDDADEEADDEGRPDDRPAACPSRVSRR